MKSDDLKHRSAIPPYSFILFGAATPTAFVPDPHIRGKWMKVHPSVVLNPCSICGSEPGVPCFSVKRADGSPKYSASEHFARHEGKDWKQYKYGVRSAQIDMRTLGALAGMEEIMGSEEKLKVGEVNTSLRVAIIIDKVHLIELVRNSLPPKQLKKLRENPVAITDISIGITADISEVAISWSEEI